MEETELRKEGEALSNQREKGRGKLARNGGRNGLNGTQQWEHSSTFLKEPLGGEVGVLFIFLRENFENLTW